METETEEKLNSQPIGTIVSNDEPISQRRDKCRTCGNVRKEGVEWYDNEYCSGKCKQADGGVIEPATVRAKTVGFKASLEDYLLDYPKNLGGKDKRGQRIKGRTPKRYRRRFDPEKLNWGEPMETKHLKQAGQRANRQPIPGDWDYVEVQNETV